MKRQLLLTLLSVAMLSAMAKTNEFSGGNGSSSSPYQIATASALRTLSTNVSNGNTYDNVYFILTSDIDLSEVRGDFGWQPIGVYNGTGFAGTFDGAGHTVSGMYIKNPADGMGLFGYLSGGTVKNVVLDGSDVTGNNYVGGIVGYNNGNIRRCIVRNSKIQVTGGFGNGGGIAGSVYHGNVTDCKVSGTDITAQHSNIGGISGCVYNAKVTGCTVASTTFNGGTHRGAIIGLNEGGSLMLKDNLYGEDVKGIKGAMDGMDVQNGGAMKGYVPKDTSKPAKALAANTSTANTPAAPVVKQPVAPAPTEVKDGKTSKKDKSRKKKKHKLGRFSDSDTPDIEPTPAEVPTSEPATTVAAAPTATAPTVSADTASALNQPQVVTAVEAAAPKIAPSLSSEKYLVWTKGAKKPEAKVKTERPQSHNDQPEATDFMGKNFRYQSMCDWTEGMRFMVMPEKYDLLVNTFRNAQGKEVSSGSLRHKIMVYQGHTDMDNGRVHINFHCIDNNQDYYYELPNGTFEDYCWGKLGVPTLAYLGDVDKARELLMNKILLTRTQFFRVDTEYDGDGFKEVTVDKNKAVTVKAVGVGTRSFPVKIIVEDSEGNQFYQCVAMSKTNSGMRDDEFTVDNEKFLFQGSFDLSEGEMVVSENIKDYLTKHVYTKKATQMSSKGAGKMRDVKVPRFTGFIIDEIEPIKDSPYYTLTLRETESRRIYHLDVIFHEEDIQSDNRNDYFGNIFGMGEGIARNTSKEVRAAIREGRATIGMTHEEVEMAMGEPISKIVDSKGVEKWLYPRSNNKILEVYFDEKGHVSKGKSIQGNKAAPSTNAMQKKNMRSSKSSSTYTRPGTPLR